MLESDLINFISSVGFPAVVALVLLFKTNKQMEVLASTIQQNTDVINDLKEIIKLKI